jgi:hypothetical protein
MVRKTLDFRSVLAFLLIPFAAHALQFPDTVQLKKDWRLASRAGGRPALFFRQADGDSSSLVIDWASGLPVAARYEQEKEFDQEAFTKLTDEYGSGAAWHEFPDAAGSEAKKLYPGLQQQWMLKGYGPEKGWLGSGVDRGRYFLVFRENPPVPATTVAGPLRLNRAWLADLDTSSQWLHVPCAKDSGAAPKAKGGKAKTPARAAKGPACFSPSEDSRLNVRVEKKSPLTVDIWLEEEESESLLQIRKAVQTVPDAGQHEYAQDMSQILFGEAQMFLVKLAQRAPGLFTWPSWQLQDFKEGRVPESRYLEIIRSEHEPGDFLPALLYEGDAMRMSLDLYYRGAYHFKAQERP